MASNPSNQASRAARREHARKRTRRQRILLAVVALVVLAVVVAALAGGESHDPTRASRSAHVSTLASLDGGPLAPVSSGGLPALWAPQSIVGAQPQTATAYSAASKLSGLPGYLLIADRGNNRILVVNPQKQIVLRYPEAHQHALVFNDDTFVEPGGGALIANEEENHAIVQVTLANRTLQTLFGHPGEPGADATHLHTPDDAYMLPNGSLTVADATNCRILFIRNHTIVRSYGTAEVCRHQPPRYFGPVNGDTPMPDGGVLVSEVQGSWVDAISSSGQLEYSFKAPVSYPSDPQPLPGGRVLLADYSSPGHLLILDTHGHVLWRYGPSHGSGRLDHPSLAMPLPNGNIAVNDDYRDRVVVIDPRTNTIVWQYGHTNHPGTAPGLLNTPDGMDFVPAGPHGGPDYAAVIHP